jgi:hypothetical protein
MRPAMSTPEIPAPDERPSDLAAHLRLDIRQSSRLGRWMWRIIDVRDDSSFESELEFDSEGDARRSGLARLAELTGSFPGAKMPANVADTYGTKDVIVVSRGHDALYEEFKRIFADRRSVEVIRDRRRSERRRAERRVTRDARGSVRWVERRKGERRTRERRVTSVDPSLLARGWWFVPRGGYARVTAQHKASA